MGSIVPIGAENQAEINRRAEAQFREHRRRICQETDRLFAILLLFQWAAAVVVALVVSPRAWAGATSQVHLHLYAAVWLGGAIVSLPVLLVLTRPGAASTRHAVAVGQSLMGALLIHLTGGRIETHFHIFGSLALLAFYRDWRVLVTASAVVVLDHLIRGMVWPASIYGVPYFQRFRWIEHSGWVAFEDIFLIWSCLRSVREMQAIAERQARLEVTRDGIEQTVLDRTAALRVANDGLAAEVADRVRAEQALRTSEARFRTLCACSPIGIFTTDEQGRCTYVNPRAQAIAGYTEREAFGDGWRNFVHGDDLGLVSESWDAAVRHRGEFDQLLRFQGSDRGTRWAHARAAPMRDEQGRFIGHVGSIEDTTARKAAEDHLAYQATHDALTGLPNRAFFQQGLEREVASAQARDGKFALLLIDLDRFKEINDTFGHDHGDAVLRELNPRFRDALRRSDLLARLGGDEFAVLLPEVGESGAAALAERLLDCLKEPIVVQGRELEVGASIGIARFPDHGTDASTLMRLADVAMYAAKRDHGGYRSYSAEQQADLDPARLTLLTELRQGIRDGQLLLHYQPKLDLKSGRIAGVEAMVRWQHPREGPLTPARFMPLAENTGLIRPMGLQVLRDALSQSRRWLESGRPLDIAINLSPKNLRDEELIETLARHLGGPNPLPSSLTLEITEGTIMENSAETRDILDRLHGLGVRIAIDDFGTGYSSLSYLRNLPVDEVKIDRGFVTNARTSEKDACIIRSVIDLGHALGLDVVAEGVEDPETLDMLIGWGCDVAQGYYFTPPLSVDQFEAWATGSKASDAADQIRSIIDDRSASLLLQSAHP